MLEMEAVMCFCKNRSHLPGFLLAASLGLLFSCSGAPSAPDAALRSFSADRILGHIRTLSSDEFEGRGPGSKGEQLTIKYLEDQYRSFGLEPGNPDGTYLQSVPLVGITPDKGMKVTLAGHGRTLDPKFQDDYVAWSKRVTDSSSVDADLVFVGYGVQAPEFQWDDFKGVDVKGKVIVVLINDPPVPDPSDPTKLDPKTFGGKAMTYYGRWTYKYEMAAQKGAAGALIVHETGPAGYGFNVVQGKTGEQFDLVTPDKNMGRAAIEGWITLDKARALLKAAGQDFDALKTQAATREFKPVALGVTASMTIQNTLRTVDSRNVVAKLEGSDPNAKDDYVVYTAHWDHFGKTSDGIFHGAEDDAMGCAALVEVGRAFTKLAAPTRRSILF